MSQKAAISIIIPLYNNYIDIVRCLNGLKNQTCLDFEVIIVDDGSSQRLPSSLRNRIENDSQLHYYRKEHSGPGATRNFGIKQAKGEYILFLDSDDQLDNTTLSKVSHAIKEQEVDVLIFGFHLYQQENFVEDKIAGSFIGSQEDFIEQSFSECYRKFLINAPWNKVIRKQVLIDNKIFFDEKLMILEDLLFSLATIQKAETIMVLNEALYHYYYLQPDSLTSKYNAQKEKVIIKVYEELKRTVTSSSRYLPFYSKDIAMKLILQIIETKKYQGYSIKEKIEGITAILRNEQVPIILKEAKGDTLRETIKIKLFFIGTKLVGN